MMQTPRDTHEKDRQPIVVKFFVPTKAALRSDQAMYVVARLLFSRGPSTPIV